MEDFAKLLKRVKKMDKRIKVLEGFHSEELSKEKVLNPHQQFVKDETARLKASDPEKYAGVKGHRLAFSEATKASKESRACPQ